MPISRIRKPTGGRRRVSLALLLLATACIARGSPERAPLNDPYADERRRMVATQIEARGVRDPRVLEAMRRVPRHVFVPASQQDAAHADHFLPIAHGQHISQPYAVARMTELASLDANSRVLEIGTGSGYQAAVLAEVAGEVYSIEILEPLALQAARTLRRLGYTGVHLRHGDGYRGWPEVAPFDAILVTAAAPRVPRPLLEQLAPGGRLVIPVGDTDANQELELYIRTERGYERRRIAPASFVPMTGEIRERSRC